MTESVDGKNKRFGEIFYGHKDRVYNFALKMLGDKDAAGDITQEVFLRLYKAIDSNPAISNMQSWLFILTRNLCLNKIRDSKKEISLDTEIGEEPVDSGRDDSRIAMVKRALKCLETRYREILVLKEYQGFSYIEIGDILGLTIPAVRSLLYKARISLRENFEKLSIKG